MKKLLIFLSLVSIITVAAGAFLLLKPLKLTPTEVKNIQNTVIPPLKDQLTQKKMVLGKPIFIRIFKEESELEVWVKQDKQYSLFKTYPICYYSGFLGPKLKEGDKQSPEGFYFVKPNQMKPDSTYHLAFNIGFPNTYDRAHGRTGSYLMVHGNCVSIGCYAMTDKGIEEIYMHADAALKAGQPFFRVHIFPFRMTEENMQKHKASKWIEFWQNLKEGYDSFETHKIPPNVKVKNKRYIFEQEDKKIQEVNQSKI